MLKMLLISLLLATACHSREDDRYEAALYGCRYGAISAESYFTENYQMQTMGEDVSKQICKDYIKQLKRKVNDNE